MTRTFFTRNTNRQKETAIVYSDLTVTFSLEIDGIHKGITNKNFGPLFKNLCSSENKQLILKEFINSLIINGYEHQK